MNTDVEHGPIGDGNPVARAAERCEAGRALVAAGRPLDAAVLFDEAAALAGAGGALSLQGESLANAGVALHVGGRLEDALQRSRAAVSLFEYLGDEQSRRLVEENCAVIHRDLGEWERAARAAERAESLSAGRPDETDGLLSLHPDRTPGATDAPPGPPPGPVRPAPPERVPPPVPTTPVQAAPAPAAPAPLAPPAAPVPTAPATAPLTPLDVADVGPVAPVPPAVALPAPEVTAGSPAPPQATVRVSPPVAGAQVATAAVVADPPPPTPVATDRAVDEVGLRLEETAAARLRQDGPGAALGDCFAAFRHYLATGEAAGRYRSTMLLVLAYQHLGRWPDALRALADALDLARAVGAERDLPLLHASLAATNVALGRLVPATAAAATAVEGYRTTSDTAGLGRSLVTLGQCLMSLGDHDAALRHWAEAHALLAAVDSEAAIAAAGLLATAQLT